MYVCMYVCMYYVCMYVCMYVCILSIITSTTHVAVPGRIRTLFRCIFWSHYRIRSAVVQYFHLGLSHMKRRLSGTNFSSENNLPMFRLNAPVIIRTKELKLVPVRCSGIQTWDGSQLHTILPFVRVYLLQFCPVNYLVSHHQNHQLFWMDQALSDKGNINNNSVPSTMS